MCLRLVERDVGPRRGPVVDDAPNGAGGTAEGTRATGSFRQREPLGAERRQRRSVERQRADGTRAAASDPFGPTGRSGAHRAGFYHPIRTVGEPGAASEAGERVRRAARSVHRVPQDLPARRSARLHRPRESSLSLGMEGKSPEPYQTNHLRLDTLPMSHSIKSSFHLTYPHLNCRPASGGLQAASPGKFS